MKHTRIGYVNFGDDFAPNSKKGGQHPAAVKGYKNSVLCVSGD